MAKGFYISGFENNHDKGLGNWFNFISTNGERSNQMDEGYLTKFPFMMPKDAKIKTIDLFLNQKCLFGFKFYDKNKKQIFQIGYTADQKLIVETEVLADNEVIFGVVAKVYPGYQSVYTDFQFQIGAKVSLLGF